MLFFFLFESSHVYSINICQVKSFLHDQSVWDTRKPIFSPLFVFEMKNLHPLCNSRWRRTCYFFFSGESRYKKLNVLKLLTSYHKLPTAVLTFAVSTPNVDLKLSTVGESRHLLVFSLLPWRFCSLGSCLLFVNFESLESFGRRLRRTKKYPKISS